VDLPYKRILVVSLGGIHGECSLTLSVVLATWDIRLKKAPQMALSRSFSLQGYIGPRALLLLTVLLTALFWNGYPE
jgi:hypothetical protein